MKKRLISVLCAAAVIFNLSGCAKIETVELNERLIIEAIGIDEENGKFKVCIEGLDSFSAGIESSNISAEAITKCYLFEGETVGMAMNSISTVTGQIPLFSQTRVLILGMETAKNYLSQVLDFFRREYTTRTDILIAVAENKASDVISADFGKNVSAGDIIEAAVQSYKHTGTSVYTPLYKFLNSAMNEADASYCPLVGIKKNVYSEKSEVNIAGTAVFGKHGHKILSKEETLALQIINNDLENGDLMLEAENGRLTLEIIDSHTKIKTDINNKNILFSINSEIICDIPEYQTSDFGELTKSDTEEIAKTTAEKLCSVFSDTVTNTFFVDKYDVFAFGKRINLKDHKLYDYLLKDYDSLQSHCTFNISIKVSIRRIGKVVLKK